MAWQHLSAVEAGNNLTPQLDRVWRHQRHSVMRRRVLSRRVLSRWERTTRGVNGNKYKRAPPGSESEEAVLNGCSAHAHLLKHLLSRGKQPSSVSIVFNSIALQILVPL